MSLKHNLSRRLRIGGKFGERVCSSWISMKWWRNGGFVATVCPFKRRKIRYARRLSQFLDSYRSPIFQPIFRFSIPIRDTSVSINFINTFRGNERHVWMGGGGRRRKILNFNKLFSSSKVPKFYLFFFFVFSTQRRNERREKKNRPDPDTLEKYVSSKEFLWNLWRCCWIKSWRKMVKNRLFFTELKVDQET